MLLDTNALGCQAEPLQLQRSANDLIQVHRTSLWARIACAHQQLSHDGAGTLCLLEDLLDGVRAPGISTYQQALCVAENTGERIAQFVGHISYYLAERRELFGL